MFYFASRVENHGSLIMRNQLIIVATLQSIYWPSKMILIIFRTLHGSLMLSIIHFRAPSVPCLEHQCNIVFLTRCRKLHLQQKRVLLYLQVHVNIWCFLDTCTLDSNQLNYFYIIWQGCQRKEEVFSCASYFVSH